ncbi:MAG: SMC-Scp complex subunit ScpB [Dongiaceae bacterium]
MTDDRFQQIRLLEAMIFASTEPVPERGLAARLPEGADVADLLQELAALYANRGVHLVHVDGKWAFRTAADLGSRLQIEQKVHRKLSRAALETLAVIAYHQPVTRAEIEEVRGVTLSKGTLDTLLEIGWVRPKGRRRTPGRPVTWVTTDGFLDHFGLEGVDALPGVEDLRAAGLLDVRSAISALGAQALTDTARADLDEADETDHAEQEPDDRALDDAALVAGLGDLPDED